MKTNLLKLKSVFSATLFVLLLNVVGMTNAFAQGNVPTGAINGRFTVNDNGDQVYFSKGNLQYNATAHSWRFAENQYGYLGTANNNISSEYNGWIDLFGWGTSGYNHGAVCYQPWSTATNQTYYWAYGEETANLNDYTGKADWGYNQIINGGNVLNQWRTLTTEEWQYIFWNRTTTSGIIYAKANVNGVNGIILLPDNWNLDTYNLNNTNNAGCQFNSNVITDTQWLILENAGAIFLPAAGRRYEKDFSTNGGEGNYWSASYREDSPNNAYAVNFSKVTIQPNYSLTRDFGFSVRLVCSAPSIFYGINATPNPSDGGTIMGAGTYQAGETCTLTATANEGYTFINWTENSEVVSTEAEYSFIVDGDRTLVANFELANIAFADENVKVLCVANWDTNGDGELSYEEAAAVTDLGNVFSYNETITSFDELEYFTGLTSITNAAFFWCHNLESIVLPSTIITIESAAFYECLKLESIIIPNSVTTILGDAFCNCGSLSSVLTIPSSVTAIENNVFKGNGFEQIVVEEGNPVYDSRGNCNAIIETNTNKLIAGCKNAVIPNTVTIIGEYAFDGCAGASIVIPNSVSFIEDHAFDFNDLEQIIVNEGNTLYDSRDNCNAIIETSSNKLIVGCKNTIIPNTVTIIGDFAFYNCDNLESIIIPNSVTLIGDYSFVDCDGIVSLIIPNSVVTIGNGAFQYCRNLANVELSNSVASIGTNAFWCEGLTSINVLTMIPPVLGNDVFVFVNKDIPIHVPCGTIDAYQAAEGWSEFTNYQSDGGCPIVFADENVKVLCVANWDTNGDGELSYEEAAAVTDLGEVFRGSGITSFDELQYFTGLTYIQSYAFRSSLVLESVVLPSTITEIRTEAFCDCRSLLSITIPAAVNNIGRLALSCDNMETIIVEEGNTVYDSRDNCNAVIITSSNQLLQGCKNTVIPNTVVSLGGDAFSYSTIESIIIPASITSISYGTFYACDNLSEITVSEYNTVYDSRNNCNAIIETGTNKLIAGSKTTVIPNTVTSIGEYAFMYRYRTGPYNITIPESVTSVEGYAFYGGFGIESITVLAEVPPTLGEEAFHGVPKDIPVYVPCGTRSAYQAAEGWSEFTNINVDTECGRQITVTVNPANTGSVTGAGSYDVGDICTLTATPESGYRFVNWTENNEVVSTNATYQFTVNANRDLVANFEEYVVTNHYICDISQFADYMSVVAVVVIDGIEQGSETLEIGAFCGDECRGGKFATYFTPTQRYIYQLPVYGEGGDEITFKLYNHDIQQELTIPCTVELQWQKDGYGRLATPYEITFVSSVNISATVNPTNAGNVTGAGTYMPGETATLTATANAGYAFANWTEGGNVVSQNATYSFTVTTARDLVANFNAAQSYTLNSGWNWFSTYIEQNEIDGLSMLEEGLGEHGEFIQSRTGAMVENFDGSFWWGDLNAVTNEDMYEVKTNAQVSVTMTGSVANPASHPITVAPGWNWIGYVSDATKSVDNALSSLTPNEDDVIQGRNAFSSYFPGWGWYGDLENMTPGQGYMYKSNGTASQTLVYPTTIRSTNTDIVDYHYNANYNKYRDVMDVMAKVIVNGDLPTSDRYELAAFVNGECRGRAKLQYVEPMQTYLAFITINGNDDEIVTFSLYDENLNVTYYASEANIVVFKANEVVGKFRNPYILSFNNAENVENTIFTVYPNPVVQGDEMTVNFMEEIAEAEMFVENELGLTVDAVKLSGKSAKVRFDWPSGVYVLRVVVDGNVYYNKVIVK